ncbi:uncharacterized protein LOC123527594 isoform X3 [Mercenaria mercenaria]|uniref:uncharacterized protein LOC123527594 isoform X3 n=1 Tax=Mercenaria mercenaria TaxID=6596 RepID=UPI00234E7253|nr:uncharacterized protein LOC123527594 isoform X3 [Mercenaria mercenaria]
MNLDLTDMPKLDNSRNRTLWPLVTMSSATGIKCYKKLDYCPKGHQMDKCDLNGEAGRYCKQCGELTFQPNQNRYGDQCRIRRTCDKYRMKFKEYGDKTRDAQCVCDLGYHFENEDQRACVPNKECGKGYGQGIFGICENCIEKNMWSDTQDTHSRCKPLRNCEKESRCTMVKSNGTFDNKCGPVVNDVSKCDVIQYTTPAPATASSTGLILGVVFGILGALLLLSVIFICCLRRRQRARKRQIRTEQLEELLPEIIKRSRKDEKYCNTVLDALQKEIEDRINNQIWDLPRELFRNHIEPARYEVLVEKYRDKQHKFAINGYMQDWRGWRGNTGDAVEELVACLRHENVKRMDIVLEVVNKMREDFPEVVDGYDGSSKRKPGSNSYCAILFPCACRYNEKDSYECKETSSRLLSDNSVNEKDNGHLPPPGEPQNPPNDGGATDPQEAGAIYRNAPTPSAPVLDGNDLYPDVEVKGQHFYDRSDSLPVQASS